MRDLHGRLPGCPRDSTVSGAEAGGSRGAAVSLAAEASVDDWIELCTACRLCDTVCPAGVPISELNLMAKAKFLDERGGRFGDWLLVRSDLFGELAARFSGVVNPLMKNHTVRWLLEGCSRSTGAGSLPEYEFPRFGSGSVPVLAAAEPSAVRGSLTSTAALRIRTRSTWKGRRGAPRGGRLYGHRSAQRCCGIPRLASGTSGAPGRWVRNVSSLLRRFGRGPISSFPRRAAA